eukprot:5614071-Prymnesium_polylepis.1
MQRGQKHLAAEHRLTQLRNGHFCALDVLGRLLRSGHRIGRRVDAQEGRQAIPAPLGLEYTRVVVREQRHPRPTLQLRLLRELVLCSVQQRSMLLRREASAREVVRELRLRQRSLRELAQQDAASSGREVDECADELVLNLGTVSYTHLRAHETLMNL